MKSNIKKGDTIEHLHTGKKKRVTWTGCIDGIQCWEINNGLMIRGEKIIHWKILAPQNDQQTSENNT